MPDGGERLEKVEQGLTDQIKDTMQPLEGLRPLFEQVARDHERRITALERHPPSSTDANFKE